MPVESLDCPNCGAPLPDAGGRSTVICGHCGSYIRLLAAPSTAASAPEPPPAWQSAPRDAAPAASGPLQRSQLASVTLGPADVAHITQLLRDRQKVTAIQYFQDKVGGTLGEAKDAVEAIEAALRDASMPPAIPVAVANTPQLDRVYELVKAGKKIEAVKAYRELTGLGLREALTVIEGIERQNARAAGLPLPRATSGLQGCAAIVGVIVVFMLVISGGCGVYLQTKPIYGCSMRAVKAAVEDRDLLQPPINGGYPVLTPGFSESSGFRRWELDAEYFAPVWGADGLGLAHVLVSANSSGYNAIQATFIRGGQAHDLFSVSGIPCP
jgi:ribosomal protein L7/L12